MLSERRRWRARAGGRAGAKGLGSASAGVLPASGLCRHASGGGILNGPSGGGGGRAGAALSGAVELAAADAHCVPELRAGGGGKSSGPSNMDSVQSAGTGGGGGMSEIGMALHTAANTAAGNAGNDCTTACTANGCGGPSVVPGEDLGSKIVRLGRTGTPPRSRLPSANVGALSPYVRPCPTPSATTQIMP